MPTYRGMAALIAANRDPVKGGKQAPVEGTFHEHRTRKEAALARLRSLEADEKAGSLVSVEDVRRELARAATICKSRLRQVPSSLAGEIFHTAKSSKTPREGTAQIFTLLQKAIDEALTELSQSENLGAIPRPHTRRTI